MGLVRPTAKMRRSAVGHLSPDDFPLPDQARGELRSTSPLARRAPQNQRVAAVLHDSLRFRIAIDTPDLGNVSDDNPYSESQFKTLKYRPDFPSASARSRTLAFTASQAPGGQHASSHLEAKGDSNIQIAGSNNIVNSAPQPKSCRLKSHGVERYDRTFEDGEESGWMGGAHSQDEWCDNARYK